MNVKKKNDQIFFLYIIYVFKKNEDIGLKFW